MLNAGLDKQSRMRLISTLTSHDLSFIGDITAVLGNVALDRRELKLLCGALFSSTELLEMMAQRQDRGLLMNREAENKQSLIRQISLIACENKIAVHEIASAMSGLYLARGDFESLELSRSQPTLTDSGTPGVN